MDQRYRYRPNIPSSRNRNQPSSPNFGCVLVFLLIAAIVLAVLMELGVLGMVFDIVGSDGDNTEITTYQQPEFTPTTPPQPVPTQPPAPTQPQPLMAITTTEPTATARPTATPEPTVTAAQIMVIATAEPTATTRPTDTPEPTATTTPSILHSASSVLPTATMRPSDTPEPTATARPSATPRPTATATPTAIPKIVSARTRERAIGAAREWVEISSDEVAEQIVDEIDTFGGNSRLTQTIADNMRWEFSDPTHKVGDIYKLKASGTARYIAGDSDTYTTLSVPLELEYDDIIGVVINWSFGTLQTEDTALPSQVRIASAAGQEIAVMVAQNWVKENTEDVAKQIAQEMFPDRESELTTKEWELLIDLIPQTMTWQYTTPISHGSDIYQLSAIAKHHTHKAYDHETHIRRVLPVSFVIDIGSESITAWWYEIPKSTRFRGALKEYRSLAGKERTIIEAARDWAELNTHEAAERIIKETYGGILPEEKLKEFEQLINSMIVWEIGEPVHKGGEIYELSAAAEIYGTLRLIIHGETYKASLPVELEIDAASESVIGSSFQAVELTKSEQ